MLTGGTGSQGYKMWVGVLWMLMVCLSDGEVLNCEVEQSITVSNLSKVAVSCPPIKADGSTLKYQLLFDDSCVSEMYLDKVIDPRGCSFPGRFEVTATKSGVYICKRQVIYPPPFVENCHTTDVKVNDSITETLLSPSTDATGPAANQSCLDRSQSITDVVVQVGCGVLLVYSLSITCITIIIWRKLQRDDEDTSVYVNTRPAELRKPYKV
ncbi:hypothetical protein INR49_018899 [Caranx melampygus]|nr:hypothetical protein INR49_018899 [Caranx melampygus]